MYKERCIPNPVLSCFQKRPVLPAGQPEAPAAAVWSFTSCRLKHGAQPVYCKYLLTCGITCKRQKERLVPYIWQERAVFLHCKWVETLSKRQPEVLRDNGPPRSTFNKTAGICWGSASHGFTTPVEMTSILSRLLVAVCFLPISYHRATQWCIWKSTLIRNIFLYLTQRKSKRNSHTAWWNFSPLFYRHTTFPLPIYQDTCKTLRHDVFGGIFITALYMVYFLYCLGLLNLHKK